MMNFPPPGAFPSLQDHNEICYRQLTQTRSISNIPTRGGIGEVPLVIHHQKDLPSCTGEAGAYCQMVNHYFNTGEVVDLSPVFIYKMNRLFDGLPLDTKGSTLKATMQSLQAKGVCQELLFPSTKENCERHFPYNDPRMNNVMEDARYHRIVDYARCESLEEMILALSEGHPVVFSLYLFSDFYKAKEGWVPRKVGGKKIGGHAMLALDYDLEHGYIRAVQSWGDEPGGPTDQGYMYIPFSWFKHRLNRKLTLMIEGYVPLNYFAHKRMEELTREELYVAINGREVKDASLFRQFTSPTGDITIPLESLQAIIQDITGERVWVGFDELERVVRIEI